MTTEKLELTTQADAATEKRLEAHKKNIGNYRNGVRRYGAGLFGYSFLAGREMNLVAELLPHGKLLPWIAENFPDLAKGTVDNWRNFAKALESKIPTVGNLKPLAAKKSFNKKEQLAILDAIPEILNGQGMIEFTRACGFTKPESLRGGDTSAAGRRIPTADEEREHYNGIMAYKINTLREWCIESREDLGCDAQHLAAFENARLDLGRHLASVKHKRKL
jgi:hypothetical protein